jgi:hypothetical protein
MNIMRPLLLRGTYQIPEKALEFAANFDNTWLTTAEMAALLDVNIQVLYNMRQDYFGSTAYVERRNLSPQGGAYFWHAQAVVQRLLKLRRTFPHQADDGSEIKDKVQKLDNTEETSIGESGIVLDINAPQEEEPAEVCPQPPSQGKPAPAKSIPAKPAQSASSALTHTEVMKTFEVASRFGGSFMEAIAVAGLHADPDNVGKILRTWPNIKQQYGPGTPFYEDEA